MERMALKYMRCNFSSIVTFSDCIQALVALVSITSVFRVMTELKEKALLSIQRVKD